MRARRSGARNECSGRGEPVDKDERRRDNKPVEGHAAERQQSCYNDERDAGDGNCLAGLSHFSIVARVQSARSVVCPYTAPK